MHATAPDGDRQTPEGEGVKHINLRVKAWQYEGLAATARRLSVEEGRHVSVPEVVRRRAVLEIDRVAA